MESDEAMVDAGGSLDLVLSDRGEEEEEDMESDEAMVDTGGSLDLVLSDRGGDDSSIVNPHLRYLMRRVAEGSLGEVVCRTESVHDIFTDYDADDEDWEADIGATFHQVRFCKVFR
jgi:hypothetical protein